MAGIYIHIPFCKKACHYCNFHFSTQINYIDHFTKAIIQEIEIQKNYLSTPIETLYFGGGTPSLLPMDDFHKILDKLSSVYPLDSDIEFTIEANPDDIRPEQVKAFEDSTVGTVLGIRFHTADLSWSISPAKYNKILMHLSGPLLGEPVNLLQMQKIMGFLNDFGQMCQFAMGYKFHLAKFLCGVFL